METLYAAGFIGVVFLVYLGSLWLNPWVRCPVCKGGVVRKGWIFSYARHACRRCAGTGRQLRLGRRVFFGPPR